MVNILPQDTQAALYRRYYLRLATAFLFSVAVMVIIGAGLLAPSYLLAREEAASAERFKNALVETLALKGNGGAANTLSVLAEEVKLLNAYGNEKTGALILSSALSALPNRVALTKISFAFEDGGRGSVTVAGRAETRGALVDYVGALQKDPLFLGVAVPVSNLATETDIPFSLSFAFTAP